MIGKQYVPASRHMRLRQNRDQLKTENNQLKRSLMQTKRIDVIIDTLTFIRGGTTQPPLTRYLAILILARAGRALPIDTIRKQMENDHGIESGLRTATAKGFVTDCLRQIKGKDRRFYSLTKEGEQEAIRLIQLQKEGATA